MNQMERIGKVTLDYSYYPDKDYYCDGAVEDELLEFVKEHDESEYADFIEDSHSWPILYHLSPQRENIVSWLPMDKSMKVLEVGSGPGAVTGCLAEKAGSVTCVDLSRKRSLINAYRHQDCDNLTIKVGNFSDIEPSLPADYDYVLLIGVFEYGQSYISTETPFHDFLRIIKSHVKPDGRIVIAIENKMGMKYWAGCREDHLGTFFSGIEDYPDGGGVRTFTRGGLEKLLNGCGITDYQFYYPYPDYKFMNVVYSDRRLPQVGELSNNLRNFDRDRMLLFDEKNVFDMTIREGLFPLYSNSYMVVTGPALETIYSKFSNDRAAIYAIRTDVGERGMERYVRKYPALPEAAEHVENIEKACKALTARYEGGGLLLNRCVLKREGDLPYVELEYLRGRTLAELLDDCLDAEDLEGFNRLFDKYLKRISYREEAPVADYDLIFANIMVGEDGSWTIIDYEWTFDERVDTKGIAFRALHCYLLENGRREKMNMPALLKKLSISEEEAEQFKYRERRFQKAVTGNRVSISDMRQLIGNTVVSYQEFYGRAERRRVEIFEDFGRGFRPENSYLIFNAYESDDLIKCHVLLKKGTRALRIDPAERACIIRVRKVTLDGKALPLAGNDSLVSVNGLELKAEGEAREEPVVLFDTIDPNIVIDLPRDGEQEPQILYAEMEIACLSDEMVNTLSKNLKSKELSGEGEKRRKRLWIR